MIVEDDPFIALDLQDIFESIGFGIIGPFANVDVSLTALQKQKPDFAIIDYNLGRETSIPIANVLHNEGVPYVFISGQIAAALENSDLPSKSVMSKPFIPQKLIAVVEALTQ